MAEVSPGSRKYRHSDSITLTLGSDAAVAGDPVTISASSGNVVLTDGTNGFLGILGSQTAAGDPVAAAGVASGTEVRVEIQGVVRADVTAAVGGSVSAGEALEAGAGALTNVDDGGGVPVQADTGDVQALTDEDADGYALVKLP